jgi:hypothetical protein
MLWGKACSKIPFQRRFIDFLKPFYESLLVETFFVPVFSKPADSGRSCNEPPIF